MMKLQFSVEISQCMKICRACTFAIEKGDLMIWAVRADNINYIHLKCYSPELKQYIYKKHIDTWHLDSEKERIFDSWLDEWNANYPLVEDSDAPKLSKFMYADLSKHRRVWLEIFKFLDAKEVSRTISLVNKTFRSVLLEEELWEFYYSKDFEREKPAYITYKELYASQFFNICVLIDIW